MTFEKALREHLASIPGKSLGATRLLEILDRPDSPRKQRQLARMERRVRHFMGASDAEKIDWSQIPWADIISEILKILVALLPILLAL